MLSMHRNYFWPWFCPGPSWRRLRRSLRGRGRLGRETPSPYSPSPFGPSSLLTLPHTNF